MILGLGILAYIIIGCLMLVPLKFYELYYVTSLISEHYFFGTVVWPVYIMVILSVNILKHMKFIPNIVDNLTTQISEFWFEPIRLRRERHEALKQEVRRLRRAKEQQEYERRETEELQRMERARVAPSEFFIHNDWKR